MYCYSIPVQWHIIYYVWLVYWCSIVEETFYVPSQTSWYVLFAMSQPWQCLPIVLCQRAVCGDVSLVMVRKLYPLATQQYSYLCWPWPLTGPWWCWEGVKYLESVKLQKHFLNRNACLIICVSLCFGQPNQIQETVPESIDFSSPFR